MSGIAINPRHVITRADIPKGFRVASIDNSIYARFTEGVEKLQNHPQSVELRRILHIIGREHLHRALKVQFVISQALHYDRINDAPDEHSTEDSATEAFVRLTEQVFIHGHAPDSVNLVREWPVARVDSILNRLPEPIRQSIETQDEQAVELRITPITMRTDLSHELREMFAAKDVTVGIPLCVYEPGDQENRAARVFGFSDFASVSANRIADVCHAASHLRFAADGDVFVALDKHFLNRKKALKRIGLTCLDPGEFLALVDPKEEIPPYDIS